MHYWGVGLDELLERYVTRDDEPAMAELVGQTRVKLLAVARRISRDDAEDAVQAAYLSLAKRGGSGGAPVLAWLLTAVARIAYRAKATRAREHAIAERLAPSASPPEPPEIAIGKEEAELLRRELWKLPADYRDALQLRYLHGLSGADVARLLGVNESTVRTRLQRGRLLLRSRLARVMHPFLVLPWLLNDAGASTALAVGGAMKVKLAIAALLLLALGIYYVGSHDRATPPRARTDASGARAAADSLLATEDPEGLTASLGAGDPARATTAAGVVVDEAGLPVEDVRLVVRGSYMDEHIRQQIVDRYRRQNKEVPPEAGYRPELINDVLRARAPVTRTDREGRFAFRRLAEPRETVLFLKEGFAAQEETELRPNMRVVLHRASVLRGRVTDMGGVPIARAGVRASAGRLDSTQDTTTDADGAYAFHCLGAVRNASAWAYAYDPGYANVVGETLDFKLRRRFLTVEITDAETRAPLATACARLASKGGGPLELIGAAWPGRPERFEGRLAVGPDLSKLDKRLEAVMHVFAAGYVPVLEPVVFLPGEEPPYLRVALARGDGPPALAGRVRGAPVAHIAVRNPNYLMTEDYELIMEADTTPGGRFLFSGLPRQDYLLVVTAPGTGKVTRRVAVPSDDIEIELLPAAILEVRALDRRGAPVAATAVHVEQPDGKRHWEAKTDERGWTVFEDLPAQDLLVAAVVEGWNRPIHGLGVPTTGVTLAAGARTPLKLTVPEPLATVVVVRDEAGRPHEGLALAFEARLKGLVRAVGKTEYDRLRSLRVTTDAQGVARAALYQGEYNVMLAQAPTPVRITRIDVGERESNRVECVVPRLLTVVRGRLREHGTNEPIRDAVLHISGSGDTMVLATLRTDGHGRFEVRGLAKGEYSLRHLDIAERALPSFCQIDLMDRDEIELDLVSVPVTTPTPHELAVAVRSRGSGSLAGARVSAHAQAGDGWVVLDCGGTDKDGRWVIPVIEAKRYRVWASMHGHETAEVVVDSGGARTDVDLDLPAKP